MPERFLKWAGNGFMLAGAVGIALILLVSLGFKALAVIETFKFLLISVVILGLGILMHYVNYLFK